MDIHVSAVVVGLVFVSLIKHFVAELANDWGFTPGTV